MKKTLLLGFILSLFFTLAKAQDTLYLRDGSKVNGKVTEISKHDIKFKKAENPDGPTYVLPRSEVASILYPNGNRDVFHSRQRDNDDVYGDDDRPVRRRARDIDVEDILIPVLDIAAYMVFWGGFFCPRVYLFP